MAELFAFTPSQTGVFQFLPTLDGSTYTALVPWNLYRQEYYLKLLDVTGTVILLCPLVGSPDNYDIDLVAGYFEQSSVVFRQVSQTFEVIG